MIHMISALLFASIVVVMAVGVLLGRSPLKGSCGGRAVLIVCVMSLNDLNAKHEIVCCKKKNRKIPKEISKDDFFQSDPTK